MIIQLEIYLLSVPIEIWALIISIVAVVFTLMKDFIIPFLLNPKLNFEYKEERPFRRESDINNSNNLGCFLRFSVKNIGKHPAINCRCQILSIEKGSNQYGDYQGFSLKWAGRPELIERNNISIGETEFLDLSYTNDIDNLVHLLTYHNVGIGIKLTIEPGEYMINLIFSGDNFKPYRLKFQMIKVDINDRNQISLSLIDIKR